MTENFEALEQLIGGYFHQDWDLEGATDAEVVMAFRRSVSATQVEKAIVEIDSVLHPTMHKPFEIDILLMKLGCEYRYQADGLSGAEWLQRLRVLLHASPSPYAG